MKNIIVGLISGCIFYKQGSMSSAVFSTVTKLPTAAGYNVSSILYFALLYAITGNLQAIPSLFSSKLLFLRERESGCYSTLPYFLANSIVHLPLIILTHIGFINLTYWLVGKKNSLEYQYPLFYLFWPLLITNIYTYFLLTFHSPPSKGLPANVFICSYMFFVTLMVNLIAFYCSQLLAALCSSRWV